MRSIPASKCGRETVSFVAERWAPYVGPLYGIYLIDGHGNDDAEKVENGFSRYDTARYNCHWK